MIPADSILANGIVLTMDSSFAILPDGAIAVKGDSIAAVGETSTILSQYESASVIDCNGQVIMPGLVNAHTHVPMTLLRGLADDLRLDVWLMGYMMPTEREFVSPEFVELGTSLACAEMIRSGITTFCDMYYFEEHVARATARAGMRAVCGQTVLKFPSPDAQSYEESLEGCRAFIQKWKDHPLIVPGVAPHAPYTCTAEILQACATLASEQDVPLHIHISETALEVQDSRKSYGMPVVPWVKKQNLFEAKVIAAHCVHLDTGEIHTLHHHHAGVAHCPTSNLKLASGIAPVKQMLDIGLNVGIGTDGPASNNDLDMFEETRLAAILAKTASDDPTTLPARRALAMATCMGARALHLEQVTGSLEPGKRADIAVVELERLHNWPQFNRNPDGIYSRIVYAAKSSDVQHVMCNGQWLMRDRKLVTLDVVELMEEAAKVAERIDAFLLEREDNILSKLLAIGELQQEESFEIQVKARVSSAEMVERLLAHPAISVVHHTHYRQYDTYFEFAPPEEQRVRYREDHDLLDKRNYHVRARLTLTGESKEREFERAIVLSRSRFISAATRPLRFYREYFQAESERTVEKERLRWHIDYRGYRIYINIDRVLEPEVDGYFLELKSRTWSPSDAQGKAQALLELLDILEIEQSALITTEYVHLGAE